MKITLALALEAFRRSVASIEQDGTVDSVALQLLQSRGKTSAYMITVLALLDKAKREGRTIPLRIGFATPKQQLVEQVYSDPFFHLIQKDHPGVVVRLIGRDATRLRTEAEEAFASPGHRLFLMDGPALLSLGLEFYKKLDKLDKQGLSPTKLQRRINAIEKRMKALQERGEDPNRLQSYQRKLDRFKSEKEAVEAELKQEPISRFDLLFADEIQELFADPHLQEAIGSELYWELPEEERALVQAQIQVEAAVLLHLYERFTKEGLIRFDPQTGEIVVDRLQLSRVLDSFVDAKETRERISLVENIVNEIKQAIAQDLFV